MESRWISIKERLPENVKLVLIWSALKRPELGYYSQTSGWWALGVSAIIPTHWMPLPEPPEKE